MKPISVLLFLLLAVTACVPAQPTQTSVQATALAIVHTAIVQTQTAQPTNTPLPPTATPTATIVYPTPSPYPTEAPITFAITPDATQVERWEEYQFALALELVQGHGIAFCEWEILGQSGNEVYVWAVCAAPNYEAYRPVVISLGPDGSIQQTDSPIMYSSSTETEIKKLFPPDIQEKIAAIDYDKAFIYTSHINWRRSHPEVPPLIILSAATP
jgi:hypothetical protein